MKAFHTALLGAFALIAAPALSGCETETATYEDGDTITTPGIDDDVEAGVEAFGDSVASGAAQTGDAIQEGAAEAGAEIREGAKDAADAVDSNVDLGDDAENQ